MSEALRRLVAGEPAPTLGAAWLAEEVLRRDRRRVRALAWLCAALWLAAAAGLALLVVSLDRLVISIRVSEAAAAPAGTDLLHGTGLFHHSVPVLLGCAACLLAAALCTVWLVVSSRQATLRQISVSLMQLSERIKPPTAGPG
jgi:hypothetical protein